MEQTKDGDGVSQSTEVRSWEITIRRTVIYECIQTLNNKTIFKRLHSQY